MRGEEGRGNPEATVQFRTRLAMLKRNGCNLLLVGTDALDAACQRLLGESSAGPRYRLFVTTDANPATARAKLAAVQSGQYTDDAAVVSWNADVRGGSATDVRGGSATDVRGESPTDAPDVPWERDSDGEGPALRRTFVEGDLRDLGVAVEEAVERFSSDAGSLSPAELRLCFDSLTPLAADYDDETVRRFLLGLTETVERYDGMAHYHLAAEYDSAVVASVEPLFDAVVEVRYVSGEVEQRWHLSDPEVTTDWLPL